MTAAHDAGTTARGSRQPLHTQRHTGRAACRRPRAVPATELRIGETQTQAEAGTARDGGDRMAMQRAESTAEARTRRLLIGQGHTPTWAVDGSYTCTACGGRGWIDRRGVLVTDSPRSPLQGRCPRMAAA